jgi:flavin reductase (DIM6/NTAB) family NADH-FMN oxidoreductase RutF
MDIDPDALDRLAAYRLMTAVVVPRPIAWVASVSAEGVDNLAPFSYFMGVGSEPPMLAISVARGRGGSLKHTARNVLANGAFTVSLPEERHLDALHATSAPYEESEFDAVGVPRAPGVRVPVPWVASARVALECRLEHHAALGQVDLLVGRVVWVHVDDSLVEGGVVAPGLDHRPLARLGGNDYSGLGPRFTRPPARVPSTS